MIDKLIEKVFDARNATHVRHWTTDSYAQHKALGHFYEDVISSVDKFIEAYQGTFGQLENAAQQNKDVAALLRNDLMWLTENRSTIAKGVPALENLLDEMAAVYMKTLYKLENLR